jgi:hypothetical protein
MDFIGEAIRFYTALSELNRYSVRLPGAYALGKACDNDRALIDSKAAIYHSSP